MVNKIFKDVLERAYPQVKAQNPTEGRRRLRLRALYASWATLGPASGDTVVTDDLSDADPDPMDDFLEDEELGILLRTDFTDEDAWSNFVQKLQAAQKELIADLAPGNNADVAMDDSTAPVAGPSTAVAAADENDSDSDSTGAPDFIAILDPSDPADRAKFSNISNIAALRIFNDVDIRTAPTPPAGVKRISPPNPLIDLGGWQEIYTGKTLWIYDARSNADECARLVSQQSDFYGTATGDSWRARASHIPEMQFSMHYQGMKIDFNGLDKYDWNERVRNLAESGAL